MAVMLSATIYALFAIDAYYSAGPKERDNDWIMCVLHPLVLAHAFSSTYWILATLRNSCNMSGV
jgi:hypothetical protein